ncbi:MAG TPA: radical SAM protein [Anaerolineaceae bacterium]|nr:radical SAM protein [Anaerolineaceae bacterium]
MALTSMATDAFDKGREVFRTRSVCPVCLKGIPARRVQYGDNVYLEKNCPQHGFYRTILWRGSPVYTDWKREKIPNHPEKPFTSVEAGCPYDCGLCPEHRQQPCCVLLEVTSRCDLGCPVCFASSGEEASADVSLSTISMWYDRMLEAGGPYNIQITGGEPCVRDDLPQIIRMGREAGFTYFQLNTNGLRIANDRDYLTKLKDAGLNVVYLQFDGTNDAIYRAIRGKPLIDLKRKVIEKCREIELGVVLVPTIVPGVNDDDLGNIVRFALNGYPVIRSIHLQPISYFGRYPTAPKDENRITIPEILHSMEEQTHGLVKVADFQPKGSENSYCSFHCTYVIMPDGSLQPVKHQQDSGSCCKKPEDAKHALARSKAFVARTWPFPAQSDSTPCIEPVSMGGWDLFIERARTHLFSISGMAFQDAWTMDLDLLQDCCITVADPEGKLIPFCAYNLTNMAGEYIYRSRNQISA